MAVEIEIKKEEKEYPEFDVPEGLDVSDLEEGDEKEVLAKIRKKEDGRICLVSVDGIALGDKDEVEEYEEEEVEPSQSSGIRESARFSGLM